MSVATEPEVPEPINFEVESRRVLKPKQDGSAMKKEDIKAWAVEKNLGPPDGKFEDMGNGFQFRTSGDVVLRVFPTTNRVNVAGKLKNMSHVQYVYQELRRISDVDTQPCSCLVVRVLCVFWGVGVGSGFGAWLEDLLSLCVGVPRHTRCNMAHVTAGFVP